MTRFYGVMVSTQDSESSDPSSNLGGTSSISFSFLSLRYFARKGTTEIRTRDFLFTRQAL